jgi:electron transfer flavoprotein alpha subunit
LAVLVLAEHDNRSLNAATRGTVTAAKAMDAEVHLLVAGFNAAGVAQSATGLTGVTKVLHADGVGHEQFLAESLADQMLAIAKNYSAVLIPATTTGKNVAPRVAAMLDVAQISDITKVISAHSFERPIYAGNVIATVQSTDAIKVITVRSTSFEAAGDGGSAPIESISCVAASVKSRFISQEFSESDRPELASAKVVVSGGRGLGSADNYQSVLCPLADKLGAALGASRAAVDAGYAPNDYQVGQTGKVVAPQLYIAVGMSGAIQHLAGMKDSKVIVAINKDPDAPIFSVADYGLVADLFEAVPELVDKL